MLTSDFTDLCSKWNTKRLCRLGLWLGIEYALTLNVPVPYVYDVVNTTFFFICKSSADTSLTTIYLCVQFLRSRRHNSNIAAEISRDLVLFLFLSPCWDTWRTITSTGNNYVTFIHTHPWAPEGPHWNQKAFNLTVLSNHHKLLRLSKRQSTMPPVTIKSKWGPLRLSHVPRGHNDHTKSGFLWDIV